MRRLHTSQSITTDVAVAALQLASGGVIAIPTDTVYGLAAALDQPTAIDRIYELKGRDYGKPLPVLVSCLEAGRDLSNEFPVGAQRLAERFWPGALTIVVPASDQVPASVRRGGTTVGLRMPDHPLALAVIAAAGGALAVTSANRAGQPEAVTAREVQGVFGEELDLIVDGGECVGGRPSAVVNVAPDGMQVLRQGEIDGAMLLAVLDGSR